MSGTAALRIVDSDPTPPYEQLRRQLAHLIGSGVLAPGDRLPPLRQLASDLGLAPGTVARTYKELESAGLVRSRRGGGTRVAAGATHGPPTQVRRELASAAASYVQQARLLGASDGDVLTAVTAVLEGARAPAEAARRPGGKDGDVRLRGDVGR